MVMRHEMPQLRKHVPGQERREERPERKQQHMGPEQAERPEMILQSI